MIFFPTFFTPQTFKVCNMPWINTVFKYQIALMYIIGKERELFGSEGARDEKYFVRIKGVYK
jgi:hypothetical protein